MKLSYVDPYCYPGTSILRNLLHLRDRAALDEAELRIVGLRVDEAFTRLPKPPHDVACLCGIHRKVFGDLYPFAGKLREHTGRMTKTRLGKAVMYCDSTFVPAQLDAVFAKLALEKNLNGLELGAFADRAAHFYGELDAVHPFREGNSRTLRLFFSALADAAGYRFNWHLLAARAGGLGELYAARDRAVMQGDPAALAALFAVILTGRQG